MKFYKIQLPLVLFAFIFFGSTVYAEYDYADSTNDNITNQNLIQGEEQNEDYVDSTEGQSDQYDSIQTTYDSTKEPVKVFILDSGIIEGEYYDANGEPLPIAGTYNAAEPYSGGTAYDNPELEQAVNTNVTDRDGHGTAMANTYAQVAGDEIASGAVEIYVVKVKNDQDGTISHESLERGLIYAKDNGANVVNMSIASAGLTREVSGTLNQLNDQGATVVVGVGNDSRYTDTAPSAFALPAGVLGVGALDYEDDNKTIATYSNGVLSPYVDIYATEGPKENLQGTSAATAYAGATIAKALAGNEIPQEFDENDDGRFDTDEVEQYLSSPAMADRADIVVTETATYQALSQIGWEYDADSNNFITNTGEKYDPLYLGIDDDPSTIQAYTEYYKNDPASASLSKTNTMIGVAPLISRELERYDTITDVLANSEEGTAQFQAYKEMNILEAGYDYDKNTSTWTNPDTEKNITLAEYEAMDVGGLKGVIRESQLTEAGFTETPEGWVDGKGTLVLSSSVDLAALPEEDYVQSMYAATGKAYETYPAPYSLNDSQKKTLLEAAGYTYDNSAGVWKPDTSTVDGNHLYTAGVDNLTAEEVSNMPYTEFQTVISEAHLAQTGYVESADGSWVNTANGKTATIDSNGMPVITAAPSVGGGASGGGASGGGAGSPVHPNQGNAIVPCGFGIGSTYNECTFCNLVTLAANLVNFIIFLAVLTATLLFVYAGALYITSSTNPGNISKAHKVFINTLIGFCIVLASWLIVDLIMSQFANSTLQDWGFPSCPEATTTFF